LLCRTDVRVLQLWECRWVEWHVRVHVGWRYVHGWIMNIVLTADQNLQWCWRWHRCCHAWVKARRVGLRHSQSDLAYTLLGLVAFMSFRSGLMGGTCGMLKGMRTCMLTTSSRRHRGKNFDAVHPLKILP
jgi:hypothetical protein